MTVEDDVEWEVANFHGKYIYIRFSELIVISIVK